MSDTPDPVTLAERIVIERQCEHGRWTRHITEYDPAGSTWCDGALRVLIPLDPPEEGDMSVEDPTP